MNFVVYVSSTEWIETRSGGFLSFRGSQIADPLRGRSIRCRCLRTDELIDVAEGGFRPSRPGLEGKMWSHILKEGVWASQSRPSSSLDNSFLLSAELNLIVQSFSIRLVHSYLHSISSDLQLISDPIPIQLRQPDLRGIIRLGTGGQGRIDILTERENQKLGGRLEVFLVNKNVSDGIVFVVELLRPVARGQPLNMELGSNSENQSDEDLLKILEDAFLEFKRDGKVSTVHCFKCKGLIEIKALTDSAWSITCPCGRFTDTLHGI
jgi:hypothetical protein